MIHFNMLIGTKVNDPSIPEVTLGKSNRKCVAKRCYICLQKLMRVGNLLQNNGKNLKYGLFVSINHLLLNLKFKCSKCKPLIHPSSH
jgi:hypothetical protein